MEFLQTARRRNIFSDIMHIALNLALVAAVFTLMYIGQRIDIALILVFLSKWRVFAVRRRYWRVNILSNLVDFSVGCSVVALMYVAGVSAISVNQSLWVQIGIAIFYALWLIVIKPRTYATAVKLQAAIALFVGVWAVATLPYTTPLWLSVALYLTLGYGVARHVFTLCYDEKKFGILALCFALFIAELGFIIYHWNVGYSLVPIVSGFRVPQAAIIALLMGLIAHRLYAIHKSHASLKQPENSALIFFSVGLIAVLLLFFSSSGPGIA